MLSPSTTSILLEVVEISPTFIRLKDGLNTVPEVKVNNLTCQTVVIPPCATLCKIEEVEVTELQSSLEKKESGLKKID